MNAGVVDRAEVRLGDRELLEQVWKPQPGLLGWLSVTTHQEIGMRYIVTAFVFLLIGGVEAMLMRLQLSRPHLRRPWPAHCPPTRSAACAKRLAGSGPTRRPTQAS